MEQLPKDINQNLSKNTINKCINNLNLNSSQNEEYPAVPNSARNSNSSQLRKTFTKEQVNSQILLKNDDKISNSEILPKRSNSIDVSDDNILNRSAVNQNIINVEGFDFVDINDDYINKPKNRKYDDECSICSSKIFFDKYICIICDNCCLCESCEKEHCHPVIKCKADNFSNLDTIFNYIAYTQPTNSNNNSYNLYNILFKKDISLKLSTFSRIFTMRPNTTRNIGIEITNNSEQTIPDNHELILYARNNKDLVVESISFRKVMVCKETFSKELMVKSGNFCKRHNFKVELYSPTLKLNVNTLYITVDVNNDEEDESVNEFMKDFPKLLNLSKEQKIKIKNFIEKNDIKMHPYLVYNYLKSNGWDIEVTKYHILNNNSEQ